MKLKNLLWGTMFTLAFTACSNNDPVINPEPQPQPEEAKATFSVFVDEMKTKADDDKSAKITTLQALVFNESQNGPVLETVGDLKKGTENQSVEMPVEGGNKTVLVVANYPDFSTLKQGAQDGISRADVFAKMKDFESTLEEDSKLTMNSKLYDGIVIGLGMKHYLGFPPLDNGGVYYDAGNNEPIKLYRNVARVKLNTITVDGDKIINSAQYTDLQIELEKVYILHAKESSMLIGKDGKEWGPTYVANAGYINGYPFTTAEKDPFYFVGGEKARYASLPENTKLRYSEVYNYTLPTVLPFDLTKKNEIAFKGEGNLAPIEFYTYENRYGASATDKDEAKTLLVLKTDYSYIGSEELAKIVNGEDEIEDLSTTDPHSWGWRKITGIEKGEWMDKKWFIDITNWFKKTYISEFYCPHCKTLFNPFYGLLCEGKYVHRNGFMDDHEAACKNGSIEPDIDLRVHFTRYYTVAVGNMEYKVPKGFPAREDVKDANKATGILRNLQYNINLTITGEGYIDDKGDKGEQFLQVQTQVVPWGIVEQEEVIE